MQKTITQLICLWWKWFQGSFLPFSWTDTVKLFHIWGYLCLNISPNKRNMMADVWLKWCFKLYSTFIITLIIVHNYRFLTAQCLLGRSGYSHFPMRIVFSLSDYDLCSFSLLLPSSACSSCMQINWTLCDKVVDSSFYLGLLQEKIHLPNKTYLWSFSQKGMVVFRG